MCNNNINLLFFNFKGFEIKLSFNNLISDLREALHLYRYSFHSLVSGFLAINLILLTREAIEKVEGIDFTIFEYLPFQYFKTR